MRTWRYETPETGARRKESRKSKISLPLWGGFFCHPPEQTGASALEASANCEQKNGERGEKER